MSDRRNLTINSYQVKVGLKICYMLPSDQHEVRFQNVKNGFLLPVKLGTVFHPF